MLFIMRAAGPLSARPPTMGEIARTFSLVRRNASRMPGTARIGPILMKRVRRAWDDLPRPPPRSPPIRRVRAPPSEALFKARRRDSDAHPPFFHGSRSETCKFARWGAYAGSHTVIRHRNQRGTNLERGSDLGRHRRERRALPQTLGSVKVSREVQIAQLKPRVRAQPSQCFEASEAVAADTPAVLWVRQGRQSIGDRIEIGRDVESVNLCVVGSVADDKHAFRLNSLASILRENARRHTPPASPTTGRRFTASLRPAVR